MIQPLILTLQLDPATQTFYESLRRRYFPPTRNLIPAHLTLFHNLPDEPLIHQTLQEAARATSPSSLSQPAARSIGRGVAVFFNSEPLAVLHASLSKTFDPHLIYQDRQRLQPHIVIQNKVEPETARHTLPLIQSLTLPEPNAIGLTLWRYLGGPWEHREHFPFEA